MASEFNFVYSCDLEAHLAIKVCTLEGNLPKLNYEALLEEPLLQFSGRKQSKVPDLLVELVVVQEENDGKQRHHLHLFHPNLDHHLNQSPLRRYLPCHCQYFAQEL